MKYKSILFLFFVLVICKTAFSQAEEIASDSVFQKLKKNYTIVCDAKYGKEGRKVYETISLGEDVYKKDTTPEKLVDFVNSIVYVNNNLKHTQVLVLASDKHFYYELQNEGYLWLDIGNYNVEKDTITLNSSVDDYYKLYYEPKSINLKELLNNYTPFPMLNEKFLKKNDEIINLN